MCAVVSLCSAGAPGTVPAEGGAVDASEGVPVSGGWVIYAPRPVLASELRACSFRHPLCVHRAAGQGGPREVLALLDAADRAWDVATGALGLPPPDGSPLTGGPLDIFLVDGVPYATRTLLDARDPMSAFDRASAFGLVGSGVARGCLLDATAAQVIARAVLFRVAPASDEATALAETQHLAGLMVPCSPRPALALEAFQDHPESALPEPVFVPGEPVPTALSSPPRLAPTQAERRASGASLFYDWVDRSFAASPGSIVRALWALSPTVTPGGAARWNDEPDSFDVLRESFKGALTTGSTVDDLWVDFAVARAFDPAFPVRLEWSVPWPREPRSLMSGVPVSPTGSAYVAIDCAGRAQGAGLRVEASWELGGRMRWAIVLVDARGQEARRLVIPSEDRGAEAQMSTGDLAGASRVLLVGVNVGDPHVPFDPDDAPWERHGWLVTFAAEGGQGR